MARIHWVPHSVLTRLQTLSFAQIMHVPWGISTHRNATHSLMSYAVRWEGHIRDVLTACSSLYFVSEARILG